jgi:hypothetical protein
MVNPSVDEIMDHLLGMTQLQADSEFATLKFPLTPEQWRNLPNRVQWAVQEHETQWEPVTEDDWPKVTAAVARNESLCPRCNGNGEWHPPKERGLTTGAFRCGNTSRCLCVPKQVFWRHLTNNVPPRYQKLALQNLKPSETSRLSIERQQQLYDTLRSKPNDSYAFFGPVGTSKTTVTTSLYRHQLARYIENAWKASHHVSAFKYSMAQASRIPLWRIDAKTLLLQHHDFAINRPVTNAEGEELGGAPEPTVTRHRIERFTKSGEKVHLFLEEIDKVELTKARRDTLFDVVNAVYEHEGQLVINTNLTKDEFQDMYGAEFVRRIKEVCTVIDLF